MANSGNGDNMDNASLQLLNALVNASINQGRRKPTQPRIPTSLRPIMWWLLSGEALSLQRLQELTIDVENASALSDEKEKVMDIIARKKKSLMLR